MLGVVHRAVLKEGPKHFHGFFEVKNTAAAHWTRGAQRRALHGKQFKEPAGENCPELVRRSALGLVKVYNLLPAKVVSQTTVKSFQSELQELLKEKAAKNDKDWQLSFSPRVPWWNHPLR